MAVYCLITIVETQSSLGLINGYYAILGISSVVALVHLIRVVSEGERAALLVLGGLMIVVATAISDVLKANDLHGYRIWLVMVRAPLSSSYILAKRFADAQEAVESFKSQRKPANSKASFLRICRMSYERH